DVSSCAREAAGPRPQAIMPHGASSEPAVAVGAHEIVVGEMRVGGAHAVDRGLLARPEAFVWIEAPDAGEQALSAQDFITAGDDTVKIVGGGEYGRVGVGDLRIEREQVGRNAIRSNRSVNAIKEFDGFLDPDTPVPQEAALDP